MSGKFQQVKPEDVPASEKPHFSQDGTLSLKKEQYKEVSHELDVEFFNVVHPETGQVIGRMYYPTEFCNRDEEDSACRFGGYSYHKFSDELPIWVHSACWKPGRKHWDVTFKDHVAVEPGVKLPWDQD